MQYRCSKCHATWESDESVSQGLVQCPHCFVVLPLTVAQVQKQPSAPPPQDIHELPTVLETPAVTSRSEPPTIEMTELLPSDSRSQEEAPLQQHPEFATSATEILPSPTLPASQPTSAPKDITSSSPPVTHESQTVIDAPASHSTSSRGRTVSGAPTPEQKKPPTPSRQVASQQTKTSPRSGLGADLSGHELGGYEIKATLGHGGMGTVYLARQKSLDRLVALKVLPSAMAAHPEFLARFTREALAAAQLTHHNVVQVYDVGSEGDTHFISMEYVRGSNLGAMVRKDGRLSVDDAVGYVLQAARALKYAHERGIVHRDIKPDNLMLNDLGIVKVADLGLAKFSRSTTAEPSPGLTESNVLDLQTIGQEAGDITLQAVAMGTPAYMAPEQARDAAHVDHRADQYALGCTLYYLITGKPPFSGTTAFEVITKQLNEPVPPIETHVRGVPTTLKAIIEKMLAKDPDDRYPDMGAVIRDLEAYLGVESEKGAFRPREIHLALLEKAQQSYYGHALCRVQKLVPKVFAGAMALLALGLFALGKLSVGAYFLLTLLLTPVITALLDGLLQQSYFVRRLRSALFGMRLTSWLKAAAVAALGAVAVVQVGLVTLFVSSFVTAAVLAAAYEFGVLRRLRAARSEPLAELQKMLKELRVRGMPEEAIQDFVARFAGEQWEELFEDLFGYEALVLARGKVAAAEQVQRRKRVAQWRDPIVRWLDEIERRRREAREVRQLAKVEAKRLTAQGMSEQEAMQKAQEAATVILDQIKAETKSPKVTLYADPFAKKRRWLRTLVSVAINSPYRLARAIVGLAMLVPVALLWLGERLPGAGLIASVVNSLPLPAETRAMLVTYYGLAAALALLITAFSRRIVGPTLVVVGVAFVIFPSLAQGLLTPLPVALPPLYVGTGFIALGYAANILGTMRGGKF